MALLMYICGGLICVYLHTIFSSACEPVPSMVSVPCSDLVPHLCFFLFNSQAEKAQS